MHSKLKHKSIDVAAGTVPAESLFSQQHKETPLKLRKRDPGQSNRQSLRGNRFLHQSVAQVITIVGGSFGNLFLPKTHSTKDGNDA
jgi:hypothetical protein